MAMTLADATLTGRRAPVPLRTRGHLPTAVHGAHRLVAVLLPLAAVLVSGCADGASDVPAGTSGAVMRDSAGVEIVEYSAVVMDALPRWTVAPEPHLEIGMIEGAEEYQFSRVTAVRTLSDGTIVVADQLPVGIRYFTGDGEFIRRVGEEGEGPGSYRFLWDVHVLPGDSVLVVDHGLGRVTYLAPDGTLVRTRRISLGVASGPRYVGTLGDGSLLFFEYNGRRGADAEKTELLFTVSEDGTVRDTLALHARAMVEATMMGFPVRSPPLFAERASGARSEDGVWWSEGGPWEVRRLGEEGIIERISRFDVPRVAVTEEYVSEWIEDVALRGITRDRDLNREFYESLGAADAMPSIDKLRVGTDGRVWARRFDPHDFGSAAQPESREWLVMDPDGRPVAWATMPAEVDPDDANARAVAELGSDYVLGVGRDSLDVQYVRRYEFVDAATGQRVGPGARRVGG